jgi:L-asparaginase/Glu-tRNA(Gln) amidotransferase subunit D
MAKNKVLIIFIDANNNLQQVDFVAQKMPELDLLAEISTISLFIKDGWSQLEAWKNINKAIYSNYSSYDGFIVVSKADTLIYSAVAANTAFVKNYKPIIFTTTGQLDSGFEFSKIIEIGLKTNLINALQLISRQVKEVMIVYGQKAILATLARKISSSDVAAFDSLTGEYIATINFSLELLTQPKKKKRIVKFANDFQDKFALLYMHPGFVWDKYKNVLNDSDVLILKSSHRDGLLEKDIDWLKENFSNKPIIIYNRIGIEREKPLPSNYIIPKKITWENMMIRTMWSLAQAKSGESFEKAFLAKQ